MKKILLTVMFLSSSLMATGKICLLEEDNGIEVHCIYGAKYIKGKGGTVYTQLFKEGHRTLSPLTCNCGIDEVLEDLSIPRKKQAGDISELPTQTPKLMQVAE